MIQESQNHTYFLNYNLCSYASLTGLGCADYKEYIRTKTSLDEDSASERFGKPGFKFSLYSLEELSSKQVQELSLDPDAIPIID